MTENEIKWLIWLIFANFVEKWLILKTWGDCVSEVNFTHTYIDAEYAICIEKCSLCMIKIENWLIMADFQRFQEKWLIPEIDEKIKFRKQFR